MKPNTIWTSALRLCTVMAAVLGVAAASAQTPPQPEAKPEPKAEAKPEPKTEATSEPRTEATPEAKPA